MTEKAYSPPESAATWCFGHEQDEPDQWINPPFLVCFECKHAFATERELIDAHNEILLSLESDGFMDFTHAQMCQTADEIFCCPVCVHDF